MAKRIFIGDIHMGDERSASQPAGLHNYCWFYNSGLQPDSDRPGMLAEFLERYCIDDGSVAEVIIVGDLFDEWVCPAEFDPTAPPHDIPPPQGEQYRKIAAAPQNLPVINALKTLADSGRLVYVPGNHDMFANQSTLNTIFPGIKGANFVDGQHHVYKTDGIWAEHGHWYGMFNAPLPSTSALGFPGSPLPLGYFITRVLAEESLKSGVLLGLWRVLEEWVKEVLDKVPDIKKPNMSSGNLVDQVFAGLFQNLISNHGHGADGVTMSQFSGISGVVKWADVMPHYPDVCASWPEVHPDNVGRLDALWGDAFSLDEAARMITLYHDEARLVVFGHTHYYDLLTHHHSTYPAGSVPPEDKRIYVNVGAWTNDTPVCTFVETELLPERKQHLVAVKKWFKNASTGKYDFEDVVPDGWVVAV